MNTGWNLTNINPMSNKIINLLGNEYWLEQRYDGQREAQDYKPTGK